MKPPLPLLPPLSQASLAVGIGCACSVVLAGIGGMAEREATMAARRPATLLVALLDMDPAERIGHAARLTALLDRAAGASVRRIPPVEQTQALGLEADRSPALPEMLEVEVPSARMAVRLAAMLGRQPQVTVRATLPPPQRAIRPGALAAVLLALLAAGWAAHHHVRRQAALLLLVRRLGGPPARLLVEALAPVALSGTAGALVGDGILAAIDPGLAAWRDGLPLVVLPLAAVAAALAGALGSLRRMLAAQP